MTEDRIAKLEQRVRQLENVLGAVLNSPPMRMVAMSMGNARAGAKLDIVAPTHQGNGEVKESMNPQAQQVRAAGQLATVARKDLGTGAVQPAGKKS